MSSVFVIVTNEFEPKILRSTKYSDTRIKAYEKLSHARGALTQMKCHGRADAQTAIIVELHMSYGIVKSS